VDRATCGCAFQTLSNTGLGGLTQLPGNADWTSGNVTLPLHGLDHVDISFYVSPRSHSLISLTHSLIPG
jgi:hypothetical protein